MVKHTLIIYTNISIHRSDATSILVGNGSKVHVVLFISDKMVLIYVAVTGQNNRTLIGSRIVSIGGQNNLEVRQLTQEILLEWHQFWS